MIERNYMPEEKCACCGQKVDLKNCGWVTLNRCVAPVCCPACETRARLYLNNTFYDSGFRKLDMPV
jgi:hypothetical protein